MMNVMSYHSLLQSNVTVDQMSSGKPLARDMALQKLMI